MVNDSNDTGDNGPNNEPGTVDIIVPILQRIRADLARMEQAQQADNQLIRADLDRLNLRMNNTDMHLRSIHLDMADDRAHRRDHAVRLHKLEGDNPIMDP